MDEKTTMTAISAEKFFNASTIEYEAACFIDDPLRVKAAEEKCHSSLQGWLDAKHHQVLEQIKEFRRNNR